MKEGKKGKEPEMIGVVARKNRPAAAEGLSLLGASRISIMIRTITIMTIIIIVIEVAFLKCLLLEGGGYGLWAAASWAARKSHLTSSRFGCWPCPDIKTL